MAPGDEPGPSSGAPDDQFLSMVDQVAKNVPDDDEKFALKAWICLDRDQFPRKQCIQLVEWRWFDPAILTLIAVNCVTMAVRRRRHCCRVPRAVRALLRSNHRCLAPNRCR